MARRRKKSKFSVFWITVGAWMFVGIFLVFGLGDLLDYRESNTWIATQGEILNSTLMTSRNSDGDITYRPYVQYRYTVGDDFRVHDRLTFGDEFYDENRTDADKVISKYAIGTVIDVYYNPDDPNDAVIERELTGDMMVASGISLLALLIGIGGLAYMLWRLWRKWT